LILAPDPKLFDLSRDPGETRTRIDSESSVYQRLRRQLTEAIHVFEQSAGATETTSLDAESRERLQSLGYLTRSSKSDARRGPPPDPMENIEVWNRIQHGIARQGSGDYSEAVEIFEKVLVEDPDIPLVYEYLGACYLKLSEDTQAEKVFRQALSRGLESPRLHSELGRILKRRGELEQAERELRAAVSLDPRSVVIHYELGNLYRGQREFSRALEHYDAALEINANYIWAWNGLAMSFVALERSDKALAAFRRVVEIDPHGAAGYFNLAVHLERSGLSPQAIEAYERFLELSEGSEFAAQRQVALAALERLSG
jgi:tetratricopeptide (TPR) repeat protein